MTKLVYENLRSDEVNWLPFMGNNHNFMRLMARRGGSVSFIRHIGKPLSDRLWQDLTERLGCNQLRVYKYNDAEWTDCSMGKEARIYLDENENVKDIKVTI